MLQWYRTMHVIENAKDALALEQNLNACGRSSPATALKLCPWHVLVGTLELSYGDATA